MRARSLLSGAALAMLMAATIPAAADLLLPVSYYNMNNGDGTGVLGTFQYWDGTYGGSFASPAIQAARITDTGNLAGSTGVLTNNFFANNRWDYYGTASGTGQYVGWKTTVYGDPTILFHLAGLTDVHSINFYADNSYVGLVGGPGSITINGITYDSSSIHWTAIPLAPTSGFAGGAEKITIAGLNLTNADITVTLHAGAAGADVTAYNLKYPGDQQTSGKEPWIMLSEVQFNGVTNAVPELSTWMMMLIGFAAIAYAVRRRQKIVIAA